MKNKILIINEIVKEHYLIRHEYHDCSDMGDRDPLLMKAAYSKNGDWIGSSKLAHRFVEKYGIVQFEKSSDDHCVCSIGYSPKKRKWFGWSHRAIFGFSIGSKVKMGNCAFMPSNKTEFKADCLRFWEDKKLHSETTAGFKTEYGKKGVYVVWRYNKKARNKDIHNTISGIFTEFPKKWGKGEWTAKTMEDAKQMAIDFAESVS